MMGSAKNWLYPFRLFLENLEKSGKLTAMEENRPMIAFSPVRAEYAVFMYEEVLSKCPVTSGPPPWVTIAAQRNKARKVGGTTMPLMRKRMRSFLMGMQARIVWKIQ